VISTASLTKLGDRRQQQLRIRVRREIENIAGRPVFDDAACVKDHDAVGERRHRGQVVADEHVGNAEPLAQILEKLDDRRADDGVEGGGHLVGQYDFRVGGQRPCQIDALFLTAGQLLRVA
jgi:hypothetical protein